MARETRESIRARTPAAGGPTSTCGITSIPNLRDAGGCPTRDGHTVRTRLLYRSGALHGLVEAEEEAFARLRICRVYDLRGPRERRLAPDRLPPGAAYVSGDVLADWTEGSPDHVFAWFEHPEAARRGLGDGRAEALWIDQYRRLVTLPSARAIYGRIFRDIALAENRPALVHCSGGKDRTGWAVGALLLLLDVDLDVVMADYLRSGWHDDSAVATLQALVARGGDPELWRPIFSAQPQYLEAAVDQVRASFGSIGAYFADGLLVDESTQAALRAAFID